MIWIFLYVCTAFACKLVVPGDGIYYETRSECMRAAIVHAGRQRIKLNVREPVCVQRDRP